MRLPGFELPEAIQPAEEEFDNRLAEVLEEIADRTEGKTSGRLNDLTAPYIQLEEAALTALPTNQGQISPRMQAFFLLSHRVVGLADSLGRQT